MAIQRPARLEQNRHGVFIMRLVVPVAHRDADGRPRDIKVSLRTRDPVRARVLALQLNADIERCRLEATDVDPRQVLLRHQLAGDRQLLETAATASKVASLPASLAMAPGPKATETVATVSSSAAHSMSTHANSASSSMPPSTAKLRPLVNAFVESRGTLAQNRRNTGLEKRRSLSMLEAFLRERGIGGEEASAAMLTRANLIDFVGFYGAREGKRGSTALPIPLPPPDSVVVGKKRCNLRSEFRKRVHRAGLVGVVAAAKLGAWAVGSILDPTLARLPSTHNDP